MINKFVTWFSYVDLKWKCYLFSFRFWWELLSERCPEFGLSLWGSEFAWSSSLLAAGVNLYSQQLLIVTLCEMFLIGFIYSISSTTIIFLFLFILGLFIGLLFFVFLFLICSIYFVLFLISFWLINYDRNCW